MENLKGRRVQYVFGAMHPVEIGEIIIDRGEQVVVMLDDGTFKYHAKYRLLCSEYAEIDCPSAVGVYLLREPFVEEAA